MPHNIFKEPLPVVFRQVLTNVVLQVVRLHFASFSTYGGDIVCVYDGNDATAPLLHTFSGSSRPSDVFSSGNTVFVSFVTNGRYTNDGFKVIYLATILVPGKLQCILCNSNDLTQWHLSMLLFPLNHARKNIRSTCISTMQPLQYRGFLSVK